MYGEHWINIDGLNEWDVSIEKVVGGFIRLGFSRDNPERMLCISSDKATIFDCQKGTITTVECDYDEGELIAIVNGLNEEISIAGQYGGSLPSESGYVEKVTSVTKDVFEYGMNLVRESVSFWTKKGTEQLIYDGYKPYIYGFSYDGNYFVFADDAGITVLKRNTSNE